MNYMLIRSGRKTLGLEIGAKGLIVRAPFSASEEEIEVFLEKHSRWIESRRKIVQAQQQEGRELPVLTEQELQQLAEQASAVIPERVKHYAELMGVTYGKISIRCQRSRWGSCSGKGNLNFNCLLMLAPPEVLEAVVVHELCHRKEMNHSEKFYQEVLRVFPDYRKWNQWLKEHGSALLQRVDFSRRL